MKKTRIAIIQSMYRLEVTENLVKHCVQTLEKQGLLGKQIAVFRVPGALEIPLVAQRLAKTKKYEAIIAFGAVLKGKTYHFEQVSDECVRGCMDVSRAYNLPVIFEVLCVYDIKDAIERATSEVDNRGVEGALSALAMLALLKKI